MNIGICQTNLSNNIQELETLKHQKQMYKSPLWYMPACQETQHMGSERKAGAIGPGREPEKRELLPKAIYHVRF